jgi:hypothetical protein
MTCERKSATVAWALSTTRASTVIATVRVVGNLLFSIENGERRRLRSPRAQAPDD